MKSYLSTIKDYIVFLFALIAFVISINGWSLWLDESSTAYFAEMPDTKAFINSLSNWSGSESQMPCYVFSEFLWAKLFGSSEYALRTLNIVFVLFYLFYFLWLYKRQDIEGTDKRKIQIFVLLTSISPFILYNMNEARVNIALFVFGTICMASLYAYCKYENIRDWIICLVCLVIGFSFNLLFFVIGVPLIILALNHNKRFIFEHWKSICICLVPLLIVGAYYLNTLLHGSGGMREKPGIANIAYAIYEFTGFGGVFLPKNDLRTGGDILGSIKPYIIPTILLVIAYICLVVSYIKSKCNVKPLILFVISFIAFVIVAYIANFRFWGRHLFMLYPIFIYTLADAITVIWTKKKLKWCVCFHLLILLVASLRIISMDCYKKENIKAAIEYCNKYNNDKEPVYYFGFSKLADYYHLNNYKNYDDVTETTEGIMLYHNNMDVFFSNGSYKGLNPLMNKDIFTTQIIWEDRDSKLLKFYPKR